MKVTELLDGTPINQKQFKKWIEALRSGEYKQTTGLLQDEHGYCCLGVACRVLVEPTALKHREDGTLLYSGPDCHESSPYWLKCINRDVRFRTGETCMAMNDSLNMSFDEIADCLEAVYVLGVLE